MRAIASAVLLLAAARASALGLEKLADIVPSGGEAPFLAPAAIAFDGARDLLVVACPTSHRVFVLDRQGSVRRELGKRGQLQFPRGVAATRDGTLYVASSERESLAAFERYMGTAGEEVRTIDLSRYAGSKALRPAALFADESGRVYVADRGGRQVLVLGADGDLERVLRDAGEPVDLSVDRAGNVYVVDAAFGTIRVYDDRSRLVRTLGTSPIQFRDGFRPKSVAIDRVGRIWVLEEGNRGIKALDAAGNVLVSTRLDGVFAPADLAIDPRDLLYVLDEGGNRVAVFRISGT